MKDVSSIAAAGFDGLSSALGIGRRALADAERVCRYSSGRLSFRQRPTDIYVATYPRSGTTWVQFILYLLTSDRSMRFEHISQVSPWFERSLALGTKTASDFEPFAAPRIFKTHLTPAWLPQRGRFIYIERDGLDVALSYFHLYRSHLGFRGNLDQFFDRFLRGELQYRSWFDHVGRWRKYIERHPDRVLALRYEEMLEDLASTIERICRFLDLSVPPDVAREVLRMASLDFMRNHQRQFDPMTEALLDQGFVPEAFIRTGQKGGGLRDLSPDQRARFKAALASWRPPKAMEWRLHDFLH